MPVNSQLTKEQINAALAALNARLAQCGLTGELCIFGGAAMVLAFNARQSTRDVDAVFVPKTEVTQFAGEISADLNLPEDWLNDGVKGFLSANGDHTPDQMPQFSHLRVMRPTAEYLLALKLMSARSAAFDMAKDREDALVLCRRLGLRTTQEAFAIIEKFFPSSMIQPRSVFFVEEIIAEHTTDPA